MKFEYGIIITVGLLVTVSLGLISIQPSEVPHWNYLHELEQQEFEEGCNIDCKTKQEDERGYLCVPLDSEQYICRPPREIFDDDKPVQIRTAFPPTFGEFAYFPEGNTIERFFDIARLDIVNSNTKEIKIEFGQHFPERFDKDFEYSAMLLPGHTFVSHCLGGDSKTAHVVEYRDLINLEGEMYIEFWGTHVTMPDHLLPCNMPELIQHSLPVDLGLGIDFGEENED